MFAEVFYLGEQSGALAEDFAMTRRHDTPLLVLMQATADLIGMRAEQRSREFVS